MLSTWILVEYSATIPLEFVGIYSIRVYRNLGEELVEEAQQAWIPGAQRLLQER